MSTCVEKSIRIEITKKIKGLPYKKGEILNVTKSLMRQHNGKLYYSKEYYDYEVPNGRGILFHEIPIKHCKVIK
jgi:hypothetical protein